MSKEVVLLELPFFCSDCIHFRENLIDCTLQKNIKDIYKRSKLITNYDDKSEICREFKYNGQYE